MVRTGAHCGIVKGAMAGVTQNNNNGLLTPVRNALTASSWLPVPRTTVHCAILEIYLRRKNFLTVDVLLSLVLILILIYSL